MSRDDPPDNASLARANELRRKSSAKEAPKYDKRMGFFERRLFGAQHREWACSHATGKTLEVAVGTGLNFALYPSEIELIGLDLSEEMLEIARNRALDLDRFVDLREGDAHALPFEAETFDTVICTYSLCNIPYPQPAVAEMRRVLRPDGRLILVDHIRSAVKPVYGIQRFIEFFSVRSQGEHMTRRPLEYVKAQGFDIIERDRLGPGAVVERLVATKPDA